MIRVLPGWGALWALYLSVLGSLSPGDLLIGGLVAGVALAGCRRFLAGTRLTEAGDRRARVRPGRLPALAAATIVDITRGTLEVARAVLAPGPRACPGIVEMPLPDASGAGLIVMALMLTLSPGSVLVDIDWQRRTLLVHVVDARDPERIRARFSALDRRWRRPSVE